MRIVDDLADQVDHLVRELVDRLVGIVDSPIHTVAEAKLLSEPYRDVAEGVGVASRSNPFHQRRLVLTVDDRLQFFLESEAFPEIGLLYGHVRRSLLERESLNVRIPLPVKGGPAT